MSNQIASRILNYVKTLIQKIIYLILKIILSKIFFNLFKFNLKLSQIVSLYSRLPLASKIIALNIFKYNKFNL